MGILRRAAVAAVIVPVTGAVLLGIEVLVARNGPKPGDPPTAPVDAAIGGAGPVAQIPAAQIPAAEIVVWLGDSTAAGVGASGPGAILPEQVATSLARPVRLTVLARSGARVADVVRRQLPPLARIKPDAVFISVGANDVTHLTTRAHFRRDYTHLLAQLPTSVKQVVVLGVPDLGAPPRLPQPLRVLAGWYGRAIDEVVRAVAHRSHAIYVDIAGRTGPLFRHAPGRYFARDHYHPDDAGYQLWAAAVVSTLNAHPPG